MGNYIAYSMVIVWPLFAAYLYSTKSIQVATLWTILGGYMFLPVGTVIDFPLIPPLGKSTIPVVSVLIGVMFFSRKRKGYEKNKGVVKWLLFLFICSPVATVAFNSEPVYIAGIVLPGLTLHDAISTTFNHGLMIVPFIFGSRFFRSHEHHLLMFKTLIVAGLVYSLFILIEVRLSPQLHTLLYGYFPHSFAQQIRFGGYRPVVFMGHGLWVAIFAMTTMLSAVTLWKYKAKLGRLQSSKVVFYLVFILIICKSMASVLYGLLAFVLVKFFGIKFQIRAAIIIVLITLTYPTLSILKLVPYEKITSLANEIDEDRAGSLQFRFDNEEVLLEHGNKKFFFGWGGWGRNRVFNDETGKDETVTDGRWIITFGQFGWVGFIAEFGLLAMSVFRANKAIKFVKDKDHKLMLSAHSLLVSLIMLDQLPNATLAPWLLLIAGILLGRAETIILQSKKKAYI